VEDESYIICINASSVSDVANVSKGDRILFFLYVTARLAVLHKMTKAITFVKIVPKDQFYVDNICKNCI
jgi:hypothetical protein